MSGKNQLVNCGLHLFGLAGLAIASPAYYLLLRYSAIFVAHQVSSTDLILLTLTLLLLPAMVAWGLELAVFPISSRVHKVLHFIFVASLIALLFLPVLKKIPYFPLTAILLSASALGCVFCMLYFRFWLAHPMTNFLGLVPLFVTVLFVFAHPVRGIWLEDSAQIETVGSPKNPHPIIMVLFDDFPLTSLLNEHRKIDSERYPSFAALAENATWFRNATTVHDRTLAALPAILTGRYSERRSPVPVVSDYPRNLFTLLQPTYRMNVHEPVTRLYIDRGDIGKPRKNHETKGLAALFSDLSILYLRHILPKRITARWPQLWDIWDEFGEDFFSGGGTKPVSPKDRFHDFVESIGPCPSHCIHFIHALVPHPPWRYLPSGKGYDADTDFGNKRPASGDEEWWAIHRQQRHLLQVEFTDRLLGVLMTRLKLLGIYDRSLLIVISDHGRGFWPDDNNRNIRASKYPQDILSIPFLIKAPFQQKGFVDDRNAETIDALPTIIDLLGLTTRWPFDGCSLVSKTCLERPQKKAISGGKAMVFPPNVFAQSESLKRKIALFGSGANRAGLFAAAGYRHLLGRKIAELNASESDPSMALTLMAPLNMKATDDFAPARVTALLHFSRKFQKTPYIAVSVNAIIRAVAPVAPDRVSRSILSTMLPEEVLDRGHNELGFFLIEGDPVNPRLVQLAVR